MEKYASSHGQADKATHEVGLARSQEVHRAALAWLLTCEGCPQLLSPTERQLVAQILRHQEGKTRL